jgi:predicted DNA binding CopG/RHH family protein
MFWLTPKQSGPLAGGRMLFLRFAHQSQKKNRESHPRSLSRRINTKRQEDMRITLRLSDEDHTEIKAAAEAAGLTVSEYVRKRIAGHTVTAKPQLPPLIEAEAVRHLAAIGGLLKQLWKEGRGADKATYQEVKDAAAAIKERYNDC